MVGNEVIEGTFGEIIASYLSLNLSNTKSYLRERKACMVRLAHAWRQF